MMPPQQLRVTTQIHCWTGRASETILGLGVIDGDKICMKLPNNMPGIILGGYRQADDAEVGSFHLFTGGDYYGVKVFRGRTCN